LSSSCRSLPNLPSPMWQHHLPKPSELRVLYQAWSQWHYCFPFFHLQRREHQIISDFFVKRYNFLKIDNVIKHCHGEIEQVALTELLDVRAILLSLEKEGADPPTLSGLKNACLPANTHYSQPGSVPHWQFFVIVALITTIHIYHFLTSKRKIINYFHLALQPPKPLLLSPSPLRTLLFET